MASLGTGYLYNWGVGFSGENSIPNELTGSIASGFIGVGNTFNAVQIIDPPIVLGPPANTPLRKSYGKFGFAFYNSDSSISPLHKLEIFSSFSGTGSGAFLSGNDFIGKIVMTTNAGDTGIKNNRAFVSLGKTLGTGSGIYTYPQDTFISINKNNFRYKEYDTWSGDYSLFIQNQFSGYYDSSVNKFKIFSGNDGGAVIKDLGGTNGVLNNLHLYEIQYGTLEPIQSGKLVRQKILFQNLNTEYPKYEQVQTIDNKAWASYNTSTGLLNNTQNVFAYAFQFIDVATTRDSGIVITSGTQQNPFEYLQKLEVPTITSGFDTSFTNYIGYCFSRSTCPEPNLPAEDIQECFTGNSVTGNEYKEFVSGVLKKYASQEYQNEADAASNIVISSGVTISNLFTYQTGQIYFNNFITGDKIKFNLYNFDYTGDYKNYHLNNNPIYPSLDFTLSYPQDFSNIDQLVAKLNQNLYNINPWVWYPYECLSGQATGIYISGKLMSFEKLTGSGFTIGNKNYNNVISYRSLRNYKRGFNLKFDLINREEYVEDLYQQVFRKGFSYLVPNVVELQGLSGTDWIVLDRRSGLYDSLTGLKPTKIPIDVDPNLFLSTGEPFLNSNQLEENILPSETGIEEILFSGGFQTLQRFKQTTYNSAPPYCNVRTDVRNINIVQATGWPVGYDPCGKNKDQGEKEEPPSGQGQAGEDQKLELFLNVKRTGWLLEPTGIYLSCITGPDYNPSKIQFSGYRVVMRNFSGLSPYGENLYLKPRNEIYISNINFWSLEPTGIPVHTGKSQCLIGSKYQVDVADIVAVPFNYDFNYTITGENQKGLFTAYNYPIIYPYKAFYPTGAISDNNKTVIGGASTGYFALSGLGGNTLLLSSGSRLSIYVAGYPTESNWATGKSVTWLASANNIIYSGFQLYYNNTGYFSGTATGNGGLGQVTYTGYLPPDAKYLRCAQLSTGSQNIKINFTCAKS